MAFILDGNSWIVTQVRSNVCHSICVRHLIRSRAVTKVFFSPNVRNVFWFTIQYKYHGKISLAKLNCYTLTLNTHIAKNVRYCASKKFCLLIYSESLNKFRQVFVDKQYNFVFSLLCSYYFRKQYPKKIMLQYYKFPCLILPLKRQILKVSI